MDQLEERGSWCVCLAVAVFSIIIIYYYYCVAYHFFQLFVRMNSNNSSQSFLDLFLCSKQNVFSRAISASTAPLAVSTLDECVPGSTLQRGLWWPDVFWSSVNQSGPVVLYRCRAAVLEPSWSPVLHFACFSTLSLSPSESLYPWILREMSASVTTYSKVKATNVGL